MPYKCQYCGEFFSATCSLKSHQKSTRYCLDIQKNKGLDPKYDEYKCECGNTFTLKGNFTKHKTRCRYNFSEKEQSAISISEDIPNNYNSEQTGNIGQLFDNIRRQMIQLLDVQVMQQGIQQMISRIIHLFRTDSGTWIVRVIDSARNKFSFFENGVEIIDNRGERIFQLIRHEFIKITITTLNNAYKSNDKNIIIKLQILSSDLRSDDRCYRQIMRGLIRFLPGQSELYNFSLNVELENSIKELDNLSEQTKDNFSFLDGFIYVIREREFINLNENVFKIGKTNRLVGERLCEYPRGSQPHYFENVKDCGDIEQSIIKKLTSIPEEFIHRKDIGTEYFEGDISKLISIIKSITS